MNVLKKLLPLATLMLIACGSTPIVETLDRVKPGMGKGEVLQIVGNPKHAFFKESRDHWIYFFYQDDKDVLREVIFENGRVIEVTAAHPRIQPGDDSAGGEEEDLQQFEKKLKDSQQQKPKGTFEDVTD